MTAPAVSIRPGTPADVRRLLEIWRRAVGATHGFLSGPDLAAIDAEVAAFLPKAPVTVAVDDADRPLGFMLVADGHMEALFVDPDCHGQGIGRRLVGEALAVFPTLTTDVNEQNALALGFYEHLGFERTGRSDLDRQGRAYPLIHLRFRDVR